jgi:hypothetical protein
MVDTVPVEPAEYTSAVGSSEPGDAWVELAAGEVVGAGSAAAESVVDASIAAGVEVGLAVAKTPGLEEALIASGVVEADVLPELHAPVGSGAATALSIAAADRPASGSAEPRQPATEELPGGALTEPGAAREVGMELGEAPGAAVGDGDATTGAGLVEGEGAGVDGTAAAGEQLNPAGVATNAIDPRPRSVPATTCCALATHATAATTHPGEVNSAARSS